MRLRSLFVTVALLALIAGASKAQTPAIAAAPPGEPVVVPRAKQYDITSRLNGETYRILVSTPFAADPAIANPVVYLLDGNMYFDMATDMVARQSLRTIPAAIVPAIVVGIGYPTDDPEEMNRRRGFDLTALDSPDVRARGGERAGGGEMFLRVIEEEVKPLVMARYNIDRSKQILYGHSVAGALALRVLFKNPTAVSTYILSSPSIFLSNREVLKYEARFAERAKAGELHLRVLVTSAKDEQYRGPDPKLLAAAEANRMVDNATELAERLARLDPKDVRIVRTVFDGELHLTVPPASLSRGLRFALPKD